MTQWPVNILDEYATVAKLHAGWSLSRFGDGELKVCDGYGYRREPPCRWLAAELRQILGTPHDRLLVGIPTLNPEGPKYANWLRHAPRFLKYLSADMQYGSAFVSRADSAPGVEHPAFAKQMIALWAGRDTVIVCEPDNKLLPVVQVFARHTMLIPCPHVQASAYIATYEQQICALNPEVVVLSHGVSATVLAYRLSCRGIQALDCGSMGAMLQRLIPRGVSGDPETMPC